MCACFLFYSRWRISKKGGAARRPKILYDFNNPPKNITEDNYEYYKDQIDSDTEENLWLAKIFSKVMRNLDMRYENNVSRNVQDNQQHNFKRCNFQRKGYGGENLNWIQCLKCKYFGHIQTEC